MLHLSYNQSLLGDSLASIRNIDCDCTIICKNGTLKAHRLILSSASTYMKKLFVGSPAKASFILLPEFEVKNVEAIIELLYNGEVVLDQQRLDGVMTCASDLDITPLLNKD